MSRIQHIKDLREMLRRERNCGYDDATNLVASGEPPRTNLMHDLHACKDFIDKMWYDAQEEVPPTPAPEIESRIVAAYLAGHRGTVFASDEVERAIAYAKTVANTKE